MRSDAMASAERAVQDGIARGLLPPGATLPPQESRPWPVMLLTALGAWLAAIPLLGVIAALLGGVAGTDGGTYIVGMLLLAGALTLLRSRGLPVFVEQLAVPALLVGGGALGMGLFRDLPAQAAAGVLAALALGLAWAIPRPWLRMLLGAAAGGLAVLALMPLQTFRGGSNPVRAAWLALHASLLIGLGALALQHRARPLLAALIETTAAGWLLPVLAGLCWWSGMSFLVGGAMWGGFTAAGHGFQQARETAFPLLQAASALLALAAAAVAARHWPALRRPLALPGGLVLAALAYFLPALGAVLLALAWTAASRRWRLATAAAVAATWITGSFYYQLDWPLAHKAVVLVAAGALLGALAWAARRHHAGAPAEVHRVAAPRGAAWIALAGIATLVAVNASIQQKESLIARGEKVFVALAPADPRSLMQGDFMRLNYRMPPDLDDELRSLRALQRPHLLLRRDARGVAAPVRIVAAAAAAGPGEMRIELTPSDGRWTLVSDAWFFREGDARRWQAARFAEFRVLPDGRALLVGLAGETLEPIPVAP